MKLARKLSLLVATMALGATVVGSAAPAQAIDSGWPCGGCRPGGPR